MNFWHIKKGVLKTRERGIFYRITYSYSIHTATGFSRYSIKNTPCRTPHRKTQYKPTQITNNKLNKIILSTTYPLLSNYQISQENI